MSFRLSYKAGLLVLSAFCALDPIGTSVAAEANSSPAGDLPVLRVSYSGKDAIESFKASKVLDGAPYRVEWALLASATDETASLLAHTTDLAMMEGSISVTLQQSNSNSSWADGKAPVTIIDVLTPRFGDKYKSMETIVRADGPIKDSKDLKGKSIAFQPGGNNQTHTLLGVKTAGLKPDEVKLVSLNPADGLVAFRSGQVDALTNNPGFLQALVESGRARVLYTNTDVGFPANDASVVRTADLKDPAKIEIFRDFAKRIQRWNDWEATHLDQFKKILIDIDHLTPEIADYQARARIYDVVVADQNVLDTEQRIADTMAEGGGMPKKVDVRLQYDTRFNDDIAAELKASRQAAQK